MDLELIAAAVAGRMRRRRWTVSYIADRAGVSVKTLTDLRNAAREGFKGQTLQAVSRALDWPADALHQIGEGGAPPVEPDPAEPSGLVAAELDRLNRRIEVLEEGLDEVLRHLRDQGSNGSR